ncbi:hypothetical protein P3690_09570 [Vibrio parahaemolyticus]|nr:hypothetical protein [Vibrio parahaemolyticus]MDF5487550.1 hypothetical protein [Vibrio parahaemolyticus]MDF5504077.1 hypothetical protein [Vibrio parahaemolyticus]MDF5545614.1 hypothetical protein [Vibrio parahaemolyticus]
MTNQNQQTDFRTNAQGHLVPLSQIKEIDLLRDDVVSNLAI